MKDSTFDAKFLKESTGPNGKQFTFEVLNKKAVLEEINIKINNLSEDEKQYILGLKPGEVIELHFPNEDDLSEGDPIVIVQ